MNIRLFLLTGALLAACGSAPVHYHTLVAPPQAAGVPSAARGFAIAVSGVSVPSQVDVPQLVLRQSDSSVALVESEQWIAPLADEMRNALGAQLAARLQVMDLSRLRAPAQLPLYRISIAVRRFESNPGRNVLIEALWTLQAPQKNAVPLICSSRAEVPVAAGYGALVGGHQKALAQIAEQIARALDGPSPQPQACPA